MNVALHIFSLFIFRSLHFVQWKMKIVLSQMQILSYLTSWSGRKINGRMTSFFWVYELWYLGIYCKNVIGSKTTYWAFIETVLKKWKRLLYILPNPFSSNLRFFKINFFTYLNFKLNLTYKLNQVESYYRQTRHNIQNSLRIIFTITGVWVFNHLNMVQKWFQ